MAFDVYPNPQTKPLNIGAMLSKTTTIAERLSGETTPTMYIRVAIIASAVPPTFKLQAGNGDPVPVPSMQGIWDQPGGPGNGNYVADSYLTPEANGVYFIKVLRYVPPPLNQPPTWNLTIVNNDNNVTGRDFTFVVADSDADSQKAWLDMATALPTLPFEVLVTETGQFNLRIFNKGTGTLTKQLIGTITGPNAVSFTFSPPATPILPNGLLDAPVTLAAVNSPTTLSATLKVASDPTDPNHDPNEQVGASPGHNSVVTILGTVEQLEIAFLLDGSGSMAFSPGGSSIINVSPNNTRWGMLKSAAEAALTALGNHVSGKGKFGVGVYPDVLGFPPHPSDPYNGPFPVVSPSANDFGARVDITVPNISNVADATNGTLEKHFTRENGAATPMGAGIGHAIGPSDGTQPWGYFSSNSNDVNLNRRWLILMTDGNQNSGEDPSDFYAGPGSFLSKKIQVATIGYGNINPDAGAAIIAPVNTTLLNSITLAGYKPNNATNYHFVNATDDPSLTVTFIKTLLLNGLQFDTTVDPSGVLTSDNPTVSRQILVNRYDQKLSFIVAWTTYDSQRLQVQVVTPLGEVLEAAGHGYTVDFNPRFRMLTFDQDFLRNTKNPGQLRFGTWNLILTLNEPILLEKVAVPGAAIDSENYDYQVTVSSRLRLRTQLSQTSYAPGDPIQISALLTLDWQGIPNASVTLSHVTPGAAQINWLASSPVTPQEYNQVAQQQANNPDIDSLGIKSLVLAAKGLRFTPFTNSGLLNMVDSGGNGTYVATIGSTSVPGDYEFLITAVGSLSDGTLFRREQAVNIHVAVVPDSAHTIFDVAYAVVQVGKQTLTQATVTVRPLDRFGNVILIDPNFDPSIVFTTTAGTFQGPIIDNHDGSYTRILIYPAGQNPGIGVVVGGTTVVSGVPLVDVSGLTFVDKVFGFQAGREAVPGANQHTDPRACLGDFTIKPSPEFVSLGGGGRLVVGWSGRVIQGQGGDDDVTVFVVPDQDLRAYSVEATTEDGDDEDDWVLIGNSPGVTQSFGLRKGSDVLAARAIRIKDLGGRIRNRDGSPSGTPGVSIRGVGAKEADGGTGSTDICVRLRVQNPQGQPLGGTVDLEFQPQQGGDVVKVRGVDASKDIDVKGLQRFPQASVYQVTVTPTDVFKPSSQFLTIPASGFNTVEFIIDKSKDK